MFLHLPANHVLLCYLARCSAPASMHARMLSTLPMLLLGLGYHHIIIVVMDDMIIIINVDYIRRRMEGLGYPAPTLCSIRVT